MAQNNFFDSLFSLSGRTAVVTGGSAGIGEMISRALIAAGAEVWIVARNAERVERTAAALTKTGGICRAISADVSFAEGVEKIRSTIAATHRPLDILVNNAGLSRNAQFGSFPEEIWDQELAVNLKSPFFVSQALHPLMRRLDREGHPAHILNIGSAAGLTIYCEESFSYFPGKAAVHHLSRILAKRFIPDRIHVNVIAPGRFPSKMTQHIGADEQALAEDTALIPMKRWGREEEMAALAISLASTAGAYMTGNIIPLDGGFSL